MSKEEFNQLKQYILFTYVIAWGTELLLFIMYKGNFIQNSVMSVLHFVIIAFGAGFAPAYSAFIAKRKYCGWSVKETLRQFWSFKKGKRTFLVLISYAIIQLGMCCVLETYSGNPWYLFLLFVPLMILGGGMEEFGWRGIMQPLMERKFPFLPAMLIQGVLWAFWHLPLWFVPNTSQSNMNFGAFLMYCVVLGCSLSLLYRCTESVAACVLLHAWGNTTMGGMFTMSALVNPLDIKTVMVYIICVFLYATVYRIVNE